MDVICKVKNCQYNDLDRCHINHPIRIDSEGRCYYITVSRETESEIKQESYCKGDCSDCAHFSALRQSIMCRNCFGVISHPNFKSRN